MRYGIAPAFFIAAVVAGCSDRPAESPPPPAEETPSADPPPSLVEPRRPDRVAGQSPAVEDPGIPVRVKSDQDQSPILTDAEREALAKKKADAREGEERALAKDALALKEKRERLAQQADQLHKEAEEAAAKLDAASRSKLEKIAKDVKDALSDHQAAVGKAQTGAKEGAKEAAARTQAALAETMKKAREQLIQMRKDLEENQKMLLEKAIKAAGPG